MTLYQAHRRGLLVLGTAVAALASVFPVSASAVSGHPPDPAVPFAAPSGAPRTLTLITGDKVA
ncbi:hypothetical protein ABZ944_29855 [Streptomyces flaveolus]